MTDRLFVLSGCSGGGKSTLLTALAAQGYATVPEPGRRVIRGGGPVPWTDMPAFLRACVGLAEDDHAAALGSARPVIFDRGALDAVSGLAALGLGPAPGPATRPRYAPVAFFAPPWREIFEGDAERRHGFDAAVAEHDRLLRDYRSAGYDIMTLPKGPTADRAALVAAWVGPPGGAEGDEAG